MDNRELYDLERDNRWGMAEEKEPEAIKKICGIIGDRYGIHTYPQRYDVVWFQQYPPELPENEWVRGAPDYLITIESQNCNFYIYAEIKIKAKKFRKTVSGGTTRRGSMISNYGCESYYLDVDPVYKNMNVFANKAKIDKKCFLLFFIDEDFKEINLISLEKINKLVTDGYRGSPMSIFSEGYGTRRVDGFPARTYLIPIFSTYNLKKIPIERMLTYSSLYYVTKIEEN